MPELQATDHELVSAISELRTAIGNPVISGTGVQTLASQTVRAAIERLKSLGATPAAEVNAAVRAEIVEMLTCTGRAGLVEAAKADGLVAVVGMLFAEISHLDTEAQAAPKLRERIAELESQVADTHGPLQAQIARLNARIVGLTEVLDTAGLPS